MIPCKWGQGQLFAFSALDGESFFRDDFTGTLAGDKIGIMFHTICRRTLYFGDISKFALPEFKCVTSDMITVKTIAGELSMIFATRHLVIGECDDIPGVFVSLGGNHKIIRKGNIEIHDSDDDEYTAIIRDNGRFAFAYGSSEEAVTELCLKGMAMDIDKLKAQKTKPFENLPVQNSDYADLYAKCISVMRSQLYSPEGNIKHMWSTPDRLPHRNMWLWDSIFHAIGHRHLDTEIARELILALFDIQRQDGFIPHMIRPDSVSDITQPPVIAWGAWLVYEKCGDKDFLKTVFGHNKKFLMWCQNNRRKTDKELYSWHTNPELNNRCDESGMDNSPRFDTESDLYAIDLCCFMAQEARYMKKIADELSDKENADFFGSWYEKIKSDINALMWCEADGFYYDYDISNQCFSKVQSVSSFLALFAGICNQTQCEALVSHLVNPEEFGTEFPVPSISKKDPTYSDDMWRGPVWINYNYMISKGLEEYDCTELSLEIKNKTLGFISDWYKRTGTIYEFYDSENRIPPFCFNRKGEVFEPYDFRVKYQSIRDYGWSVTLTFDWLNN